jgi:pimeloyl-ACP methyl ester carboxylesterase
MGNKVFYDLALGLAANGIATYRYHKRFNVYPELQKTAFTVQDETVNDALAAVRQILADTSLPTGKVFVFGHSLGGYAAPMIGDSLPDIAGLILGAAPARKIEDVLEYQFQYFRETGSVTKWQYLLYNPMHKKRVAKIRKGKFKKGSKPMLVYMPGSFFKSVANYDPAENASKQEIPLLVLQGEKDFQVTMVDFDMFKDKLQNRKNTAFISYPTLNHLFMTSTMEKPTTVEYFVPSNVSYSVINDISVWIKKVE